MRKSTHDAHRHGPTGAARCRRQSLRSRHQLGLGDRPEARPSWRGSSASDGLAAKIGGDLAHHILDPGFFEIGLHHAHRVFGGLIARFAQQAGGPEAQQLVAARLGAELHFGVMGEFGFEGVFAVVKGGHGGAPCCWFRFCPHMPLGATGRKRQSPGMPARP